MAKKSKDNWRDRIYNVKLPRTAVNGARLVEHPLVTAIAKLRKEGGSVRKLAATIDVRSQVIQKWLSFAKANRDFLIPSERVPKLSKATGIDPFYYRPDLWKKGWKF